MDYTLQDLLNAGLPATRVYEIPNELGNMQTEAEFSRGLTPAENLTFLTFSNPDKAKKIQALVDAANLGNWWTWTQAQFNAWCDGNLMTDAAIDGLTLNAALKTNLKANNLFTRNAGKLLIAMRDVIKWIIKQVI